ncbi:MAG: hypothetical protein WCS52_11345 [bacterium]
MPHSPVHSTLVVDGHVHIYPPYDWAAAIKALIENLTSAVSPRERPNIIPIGLLAESKTCRFFNDVVERGAPLTKGPLQIEAGPDAGSLIIRDAGVVKGYLIAGRQLVTLENLEVLALGKNTAIANGQPLAATLQAISGEGAVPVLSWSPGKWFFRRGKLVQSTLTAHAPGSFLLGDIGLRPTLWAPHLMKTACQRGFKIIGGSDSLPLPSEERWIGRNGFQVIGAFDPQQPAASLRTLLLDPTSTFLPVGRQSSLFAFATRWGRNQLKAII